jgi:hypothetical protein
MQELTKKDATIVDLEEQLRKVYEVRPSPTILPPTWCPSVNCRELRRRPSGIVPTRPPTERPNWKGRWWRRSP